MLTIHYTAAGTFVKSPRGDQRSDISDMSREERRLLARRISDALGLKDGGKSFRQTRKGGR